MDQPDAEARLKLAKLDLARARAVDEQAGSRVVSETDLRRLEARLLERAEVSAGDQLLVDEQVVHAVRRQAGVVALLHQARHLRLRERLRPRVDALDDLAGDLKNAAAANRQVSMFFSTTDPGYSILTCKAGAQTRKMVRRQQLSVSFLDDADHTFSRHSARNRLIDSLCGHLTKRYLK